MLIDLLANLITLFFGAIANILPTWQVWPADLLNGIAYFFGTLKTLNFILPIDIFFNCLLMLTGFLLVFYPVKMLLKLFKRD